MKITINLDYPQELVEAFAKAEGIKDEVLNDFCVGKLKEILVDRITKPFKEATRKQMFADMHANLELTEQGIDANASEGIEITVE